jgi:AraC family transcriptional regulator
VKADRLRGLLDVVEESLDLADLDGLDLARRAYLTRFHFDRLVKAALGEPPGAFRRRLLLERAAHRLVNSDDRVIAVAMDAGYASPEAFTRAFARAYRQSPSTYRRAGAAIHDLPSPNHIHFHPPGGLRLPAEQRSTSMDVLRQMLDHHLDLVDQIIDCAATLDDDALDRPIELSVEGIDRDPTLRSVTDRLVSQLEMWLAATEGQTTVPSMEQPVGSTPAEMKSRLADAAPRFRKLTVDALDSGRTEETFLDATCEPPQVFTYGGMLAHVLTFAAVRRTMAIGALETEGITDLGAGDPMHYVGGNGDDASTITRRTT